MRRHHHAGAGGKFEGVRGGEIHGAVSAYSRGRSRHRGSRPTAGYYGGRDRPSARCCRSTPERAQLRLSRCKPRGTSGHASSRCQARLSRTRTFSGRSARPNRGSTRSRFCAGAARRAWRRRRGRRALLPCRAIFAAPASAKASQSSRVPERLQHRLRVPGDAAAPIDERAEYVEEQRLDAFGFRLGHKAPSGRR